MKPPRPRLRLRTVLVLFALASLPIALGMRHLRDRMEAEVKLTAEIDEIERLAEGIELEGRTFRQIGCTGPFPRTPDGNP